MANPVTSTDTLTEAAALALKLCDDIRNAREYHKQGNSAVFSPLAETAMLRVATIQAMLGDAFAAAGAPQGKVLTLKACG